MTSMDTSQSTNPMASMLLVGGSWDLDYNMQAHLKQLVSSYTWSTTILHLLFALKMESMTWLVSTCSARKTYYTKWFTPKNFQPNVKQYGTKVKSRCCCMRSRREGSRDQSHLPIRLNCCEWRAFIKCSFPAPFQCEMFYCVCIGMLMWPCWLVVFLSLNCIVWLYLGWRDWFELTSCLISLSGMRCLRTTRSWYYSLHGHQKILAAWQQTNKPTHGTGMPVWFPLGVGWWYMVNTYCLLSL